MSNSKTIPYLFINFRVELETNIPIAVLNCNYIIYEPVQIYKQGIGHNDMGFEYLLRETRKARVGEWDALLAELVYLYEEESGKLAYIKPIREIHFVA